MSSLSEDSHNSDITIECEASWLVVFTGCAQGYGLDTSYIRHGHDSAPQYAL